MTFDELYFSVKKKIQENSGIVLDNKLFAVTLGDIYGNAFMFYGKTVNFLLNHIYIMTIMCVLQHLKILWNYSLLKDSICLQHI